MTNKVLYWIPRILNILAILFMMLFSLDVFDGPEPLSKQLLGFLIHNIPAFILGAVLFVAWKYELLGGILIIVLAAVASWFFMSRSHSFASLIVTGPFFLAGLLFLLHHFLAGKPGSAGD